MAIASHIIRKNGVFHLRVRIPLDLVEVIGRQEFRRSLGTGDVSLARIAGAVAAADVKAMLVEIRMASDAEEQRKRVEALLRRKADLATELASTLGRNVELAREIGSLQSIRDGRTILRLSGAVAALAAAPQPPPSSPDPFAGLDEKARQPWHSLIEEYFESNAHLSVSTRKNYRTGFRYLADTIGTEKPIALVDRLDITRCRDRIVATAEARGGRSVVAAGTQTKLLTALKSLFSWAESKSYRVGNPVDRVVCTRTAKVEAEFFERRSFEPEELDALFSLPLFRGALSDARPNVAGKHLIRDHRFWFPLVALWTGARKTELMAAKLDEIQEHGGVIYIAVATKPEKGEDSPAVLKAFERRGGKSRNAKRIIPLHPTLLHELGFARYLERRRRECGGRSDTLFPHFGYGQLFNQRLLPAIALGDDPTVSLHSFRHTFKDMLREGGIDGKLQDRLLGHAPETAGDAYGKPLTNGEIRRFYDYIKSPVDLSCLYPAAGKR